ncbi:MAG TPA: NosD domain-containing protein [Candidatus Nanoarchaeia archaeon]|nr:NosD domain-containing protein [Candidatus Nanoarchaeia archaeon]
MRVVFLFIIAASVASACIDITDGSEITQNVQLCSRTYDLPSGITVRTSNIRLDCGTAILRGFDGQGVGIKIENADNVTVRNCHILTFDQGMLLKNVTNSLIEDNGLLKNRIGIRMIESYENTIRKNNDRSHQLAISAVSSKFNVVMFGNRDIDRAFCEVNACNRERDMQVCENGDFYCSARCSPANDDDCGSANATQPAPQLPAATALASQEIEHPAKTDLIAPETTSEERHVPLATKIIIYLFAYAIGLVVVKRVNKKR